MSSAAEKLKALDVEYEFLTEVRDAAYVLLDALPQIVAVVEGYERTLYIAEHLFQMIPQSVWREHGGDDMQGHYEGDYHAEKVQTELAEKRAALADLDSALESVT